MYFYKRISSSGWHILYKKEDKEFQIAIMRWTNGLNPIVEKAVEDDARRIVACLNFCDGIDTNILEAECKTNKPMQRMKDGRCES